MKVIYLHQYFNTPDMPGATRSYELARRLVEKGHQVHMITSDRSGHKTRGSRWRTTDESGITVHWARVPYSNKMSFWMRLRSFGMFAALSSLKAGSIDGDIVFASSTPLTIALPGIYASKRTRKPMVFEVRDLWPEVPIALGILTNPAAKWAARGLEKAAYRHASHIVALAPGMKDEISRKGYPYGQISVIPNGCDVALFANRERDVERLRREHAWLEDRPLIVYAGALGRINAVDYLVDIAAHVQALDPEIRFAVVGTGIEADNIERRATEKGVLNRSFFMMGQLPKTVAAVWISAASMTIALVQGPRFIWKDASQNKYFDSLAAATPVASNYDGWQAEVATAAGAGIILDHDNAENAARRLVTAVQDRRWLSAASAAARTLATTEFSRDRQADELERVLKCASIG